MQMTEECRKIPRSRAIKVRLFAGGFLLLILALGFNALLTYGSLEKLYVESVVSSYQVVGKDLQRKLEQSLRFGKNIQKFIGMNQLLEETKNRLTTRDNAQVPAASSAQNHHELGTADSVTVSVALPDASILYSADEELVGTNVPKKAWVQYGLTGAGSSRQTQMNYAKYQHSYLITLPVFDRDKTWVASIVMGFGEEQAETLLHNLVNRNLVIIAIIMACCVLLLLLMLNLLVPADAALDIGRFPKTKVCALLFIIVGLAQILFSGLNTNDYRNYFLQITREKVDTLVGFLKQDIEYLFSKGIQIDRLVKMDVLMGEIIAASPELNDLTISDQEQHPLYRATKDGVTDFQKMKDEQRQPAPEVASAADSAYNIRAELTRDGVTEGAISGTISKEVVAAKTQEVILDSATVLVISLLFLVEILILILPFIERQILCDDHVTVRYQTMRPAAFLFLFGVDICISFLPLYMERLYEPLLGLSKDIVIGIPISVRMFFTGISILAAGTWCDRRGWHEPFLSGLVLAGFGFIYAWLAPNALQFIASQALFGVGYGFSLMASQGFIISCTDETNRARGLAQLWAGVYAGSICGGAAGAMLAERIGYGPIFFLGAMILFLIVPYTLVFMRGAIRRPQSVAVEQETRSFTFGQFLRFASNRNISSIILFSSLPTAIALVGFLNYFSPIYLNRIGTTQSDIGRVLMVYGVCLIYIAPFISKYVDAWPSRKPFIVISGLFGGLAVFAFSFIGGLLGISLSVFLLGLSSSFGFASQSAYVLRLKVTQELGKGRALGIYSSANRIGQVLGPLTFGWLIVGIGISQGIMYFGIAYLLMTSLFMIVAQSDGTTAS
jgi:predicted MFS family arabinose efflux permease